jgi:predicted Zn-dependent protease
VPDLLDLCAAAVEAAVGGEHVEAFGEERSTTSVEAHRGEVEGLTFAESRGVGSVFSARYAAWSPISWAGIQ